MFIREKHRKNRKGIKVSVAMLSMEEPQFKGLTQVSESLASAQATTKPEAAEKRDSRNNNNNKADREVVKCSGNAPTQRRSSNLRTKSCLSDPLTSLPQRSGKLKSGFFLGMAEFDTDIHYFTLVISFLRKKVLCELKLWKWVTMVLMLFCGRLLVSIFKSRPLPMAIQPRTS